MNQRNLQRIFRPFFSLLLGLLIFAVVIACGNSGNSGTTPTGGYQLTLAATPTSLAANAVSAILVTVRDHTGNAAAGVAVSFNISTNNSGATLTTTTAESKTDAEGVAFATYTAGRNTPDLSLDDVVTARVGEYSSNAIITRLPNMGTGNRIESFTQTPGGSHFIMTVKVTRDDLTSPVAGETVTFSIILGDGIITDPDGDVGEPVDVLTDTNGEAYVIFTYPDTGSGETIIRAQIPGTTNGDDAVSIVSWSE